MADFGVVRRLPLEIATKSDLVRAYRELKNIIDELSQASLIADRAQLTLPRASDGLVKLAQANSIDINNHEARSALLASLENLKEAAPVIHISFASEPTSTVVKSVAEWFRQQVNPHTLLQVGIQPSIVAGCIVRTPNKVFNLSLSKHLQSSKTILKQRIASL